VFKAASRYSTRNLELDDGRDGDRDTGTAAPLSSAPLESAAAERVRASFARQGAMETLGAELAELAAGRVTITLPIEPRLSQQDGFLHAGVVVAALDSACGYAALTLMPDDAEVLTVELKANLLAPAGGDRLVAEGEVVRAGRTLTVCRGDAFAEQGAERVHVATMLATMVRRRATA
jgi:uncharacterized protein (TIGR00369 family)